MKVCAALFISCLWCWSAGAAAANTDTAVMPDWLLQIQQQKNIRPEAMLQVALDHQADFGNWNAVQQASWLNELSLIYEALGRHRDQLAAAERGLALLPDQLSSTRVELLFSMGFALEMHREYAQANEFYKKGMALATELNDEKLMIQGQLNLAAMLAEENQSQDALATLKQAYDRAVKLGDKETLASVNAELGLMYTVLMSDEEARKLLEESYRLFDELGWEKSKISVWYNLAMTYGYLSKPELALEIFDKMLKASLQAEDPIQTYYAYLGLATTNRSMKKYDAAVAYMEQADVYLPNLQSTYQLSEHHFEKALIYRALGQTSLAFQEVDLAAEQLGNKRNVSDQFFALHFDRLKSHLYADKGDFEKAYGLLDQFIKNYVNLQDDKRDLQVQKLRLSFDAERQQAKNELLQKDNELQALRLQEVERKRQIQWLWIGLFASTSLILLTLLLWQWRRRRQSLPASEPG
jgi:tetratricopeptide (TPR) repeat protein